MTEQEIFDRVVRVVCEKITRKDGPLTPEMVRAESDFIKDLGADSLRVLELVMGIEDEFELDEIPESDVEGIRTVSDVVTYLSRKLK
ncbi:MAG: acyl carrier protein [Deltaproteobacteria bacterium]|nr:acyl carrier protein [Deltaproteobacteria bacterium]